MTNPLIQHAITMAYHPTQSSKLQSTKSFLRIISSATNTSGHSKTKTSQIQKLCQSKEALDALVHLSSSSVIAEIAREAMLSWHLICQIQERDTLQSLVIDYEILHFLSRQLMHHDVEVKILAAKCVGELAKWAFTCRRMVPDKALQPLCALIRPNQDWKLLQAACFALSMIHSTSEMMNRMIIVWGMTPLKETINRLLVHINKELEKRNQMSITERRIRDNQRSPSVDLLCAACKVWENFSKYEKLAAKMHDEGILDQLEVLLRFETDTSIRIEASKTVLNLTLHQSLRTAIMRKESMLLAFFSCANDSNFEVKHSVAKAMDNILANCSPKEQDYLHALIIREATIPFIDWMLKTVNCNNILAIALEALTAHNSQCISTQNQDAFGSDVFRMLMTRLKSSVDATVKHMCAEALYCFAAVPCFRDEIMRAQAAEMLVYMLSSKEPLFQTFAVKTLAQLCDSTARTSRFIDLGLSQAAVKQYVSSSIAPSGFSSSRSKDSLTSAQDMEYLLNATIILYALSEFSDFRNLFVNNSRALNRFLYIFDHTNHHELLSYSLLIMCKLTSSANKEGSGNGNLKIMTEKRLHRILGFLATPDLPESKYQQLILDLIKSFLPHRNIPMDINKTCFWEISVTEVLKLIPPKNEDDRLANESHKVHLMKFVYSLLKHPHVVSDVNWDRLMHGLMTILVESPPLAEARLVCVQCLSTLKSQHSESMTEFLDTNFDYCRRLQLEIKSNNELMLKFARYLKDYIDNFTERKAMAKTKSKNTFQVLRSTLMKDPTTFSEKIRANMSGIKRFYENEHEQRVQEAVRRRQLLREQEEKERNKYALLQTWKSKLDEEVTPSMPELLDIHPATNVKLRVNMKTLKGDLDPKFEKRMKRKIKEFERLNSNSQQSAKSWQS